MLATSWIVIFLFLRTSPFTSPMFSSVWLISGCLEHLTSSAEVTLLFNLENHSKTYVLPIICSQKPTLNTLEVSVSFYPSSKQKLIQMCYLFKSAISGYTKITSGTTHTCTELLSNHMWHSLILSRKWLGTY
jgi:hypothetical protein